MGSAPQVAEEPRNVPLRLRSVHRAVAVALVTVVTIVQAAYFGAPSGSLAEASTLLIALAFAAVSAVAVALLARDSDERLFWSLFTLCGLFVFVGRVILALVPDSLAAPSPANYFDLMAIIVFLVDLALTTRFRESARGARLRYLADLLAAFTVVYVVVYSAWLVPLFRTAGLDVPSTAAASVYPAAGVLMVFGTAGNLLVGGRRRETWEVMLSVGFAFAGVACVLWPLWYVDMMTAAQFVSTPIIEILWVAGVGTLGLSAMFRLTEREEPWRPPYLGRTWWPSPTWSNIAAWSLLLLVVPAFTVSGLVAAPSNRWAFLCGVIVLGTFAVFRSTVTSLEAEARARWSDTDSLTGLPEAAAFRARLVSEVALARRHGEPLAVCIVDIDDFSYVNDSAGFARGDRLLRRVARTLRAEVGREDVLARQRADRFLLMLARADEEHAVVCCERIRARLSAEDLAVTVSTGIAVFPAHGEDAESLLDAADAARRIAKCDGKDRVAVYDEDAAARTPAEQLRMLEERARLETVRLVAESVDARLPQTAGHSRRVAEIAVALASRLGLSKRRVRLIEIAALVHDVGKVGVPDSVIAKAEDLAAEEREMVEAHPALSAAIVSATGLTEVAQWVESHHERWDGSGYPRGLAAEDIPLEARILALCSTYDALLGERPWRDAMDAQSAAREIIDGKGAQFDPVLADRLLAIVSESHWEVAT